MSRCVKMHYGHLEKAIDRKSCFWLFYWFTVLPLMSYCPFWMIALKGYVLIVMVPACTAHHPLGIIHRFQFHFRAFINVCWFFPLFCRYSWKRKRYLDEDTRKQGSRFMCIDGKVSKWYNINTHREPTKLSFLCCKSFAKKHLKLFIWSLILS